MLGQAAAWEVDPVAVPQVPAGQEATAHPAPPVQYVPATGVLVLTLAVNSPTLVSTCGARGAGRAAGTASGVGVGASEAGGAG